MSSAIPSASVADAARREIASVAAHEQTERLGTGHAVLAAREALARGFDDILVLFGDTPLIGADTLARARATLADGADVCVVGFRPADPTGYGRLIEAEGELIAIREEKDADAEERRVGLCNAGVMAFRGDNALAMLDAIGNANAKGEYYLTDLVAIARNAGRRVRAIEADANEVLGVNTREELAQVEALWQGARRRQVMLSGVTLQDPGSVFFSHDTELEPDVFVEPQVVFGPGVRVEAGATIHAFSHLEGCHVGPGASVGPFARLRPGTVLGDRSKVGNFVETKKTTLGEGAKANHLSYIGDAHIGARANIGAGTITCNYDGVMKHHTSIGEEAFIGSNTMLVAPVTVGQEAMTASGSVITQDVPAGSLAIARTKQDNKPGLALKLMKKFRALKAAKRNKTKD